MTRAFKDTILFSFSLVIIFVPGGARSILLKPNGPSRLVCTDTCRFRRYGRSMFNFVIDYLISLYHRFMGKLLSLLQNNTMQESFHILISHSESFLIYMPGGTRWYYTPSVLLKYFGMPEASFSSQ